MLIPMLATTMKMTTIATTTTVQTDTTVMRRITRSNTTPSTVLTTPSKLILILEATFVITPKSEKGTVTSDYQEEIDSENDIGSVCCMPPKMFLHSALTSSLQNKRKTQ
jgi:hypothetical protein